MSLFELQEKPAEAKKAKKEENGAAADDDEEGDGEDADEEIEEEEYDLPYGEDEDLEDGEGKHTRLVQQ